jgi:ArsR family transcriptional regulator
MINDTKYVYMTQVMKAMAHPTRLFIVDLLNEREHCVCELQEQIGSDMSTISRHLAVLRNAGIIDSRKENNQVFYRLLCPCVLEFYHCVADMNHQRS